MRFSELMRRIGEKAEVREVRTWGGKADSEILRVCEDSRKVRAGDLFVARGGTKADGSEYIADALKKGAVAVVGETVLDMKGTASAEVGNANLAPALLAHEVAGNPTRGMKVIGVTGTKGKTTVAYLMRSVLKAAGKKVGMIGTVEIDDGAEVVAAEMTTPGVVELVQMFERMRANGVTHCVMEVSSHALHQRRTAGIDFAVGIFTNLTGDHLDYHKTMEEYAAAKAILFEGLGEDAVAVVNGDDKWCERMVRGCRAQIVKYQLGGDSNAIGAVDPKSFLVDIQEISSSGMRLLMWPIGPSDYNLSTPLVGRHNAYNLAAVCAALEALGVDEDEVCRGLENNIGAPGRLQPVCLGGSREAMPFQVFVDYAHTHDALENVLVALRITMTKVVEFEEPPCHEAFRKLICVFGCGGDRDRTKRPKMGAIAERLADNVIVTSDNPRTEDPGAIIEEICAGFSAGWRKSGKVVVEPDRRAAIRKAIAMARANDVVLIAGKGHENYQIIGTTKHHFDDVEEAMEALKAQPVRGVGTMGVAS